MTMARWMTGSMVAIALLAGGVVPAQARPYHHDHWRHRGGGFGFGDAVGVAALVGAVAIVASSASKDKQASQRSEAGGAPDGDRGDEDHAPPPAQGTDYGEDQSRDGRAFPEDRMSQDRMNDDRMSDACALAAREEAEGQDGGYAEVRRMDAPRASNGGYDIDGEVETRASYSAGNGSTRRFTCSMQDGRVAQVYLSRDVVTR